MVDVTGPVGIGIAVVGDVGGLGSSTNPMTDGARNWADGGRRRGCGCGGCGGCGCGSPIDPREFVRGNRRLGLLAIPGRANGEACPSSGCGLKADVDGLLRRPP